MNLNVRLMTAPEIDLIINYFWRSTPEELETIGVDPTRLPDPEAWRRRFQAELMKPVEERANVLVSWLMEGQPIGFSTADKIVYGEHANMHLHVTQRELRKQGLGVECVRRSADLYFRELRLKRLFCEPNAFNVAPNRTLQRAGFSYLKSHMTVPGPLNFHQAVTRWVWEPRAISH